MLDLDALDFAKGGGLVTVVTQDARSGAVLMVAHADREAIEKSLATGEMHYRSRTRGLWHKGATSGNAQRVVELAMDCDGDAVLALVVPKGPACHTNAMSCFGDVALAGETLSALDATIRARATEDAGGVSVGSGLPPTEHPVDTPRPSYTRRLLADRNLRLKKLGEESAELVAACADGDADRAANEAADLLYHTLVALRAVGVGFDEVRAKLWERS